MGLRVVIMTKVYGRRELALAQMRSITELREYAGRKLNIQLDALYLLSEHDSEANKRAFYEYLQSSPLDWAMLPEKRLSNKAQAGLYILQKRWPRFDYLMHLDSDEFISRGTLQRWKLQMLQGREWFGSRGEVFYVAESGEAFYFDGYKRLKVINGGNTIARSVLEAIQFVMWTPGLEFGLNYNEQIRLTAKGFKPHVMNANDSCGIVEVKTGGISIHPMKWFIEKKYQLRNFGKADYDKLYREHPTLKATPFLNYHK